MRLAWLAAYFRARDLWLGVLGVSSPNGKKRIEVQMHATARLNISRRGNGAKESREFNCRIELACLHCVKAPFAD